MSKEEIWLKEKGYTDDSSFSRWGCAQRMQEYAQQKAKEAIAKIQNYGAEMDGSDAINIIRQTFNPHLLNQLKKEKKR